MVEDSTSGSAADPERPDSGLHPQGQLDARFPVAYRESVPRAMRLLTEYFTALSRRDPEGMARVLQFPFVSYEGTEPVVIESEEEFLADPPRSMNVTGEGESHVEPGSVDVLDDLRLHVFTPVGAGCSLSYNRYDADGNRLLRCEGVYAVTNNDGTWGIELLSTIFTPDRAVGETYEEAEETAIRLGREWMLGYTVRDQELLNGTRQHGKTASVTLANPRANTRNARDGTPMDGYPIEGVDSRLRVREVTPESLAEADADFEEFAALAGGGVGQWDYTVSHPEAEVLHATANKVHTAGGYVRHTAGSRPISETRSLSITTYRDGRWGRSGGFGAMMYRDRTNDLLDD